MMTIMMMITIGSSSSIITFTMKDLRLMTTDCLIVSHFNK